MASNWQDVTTFGAVGDGTTDDTAAIQDAIDAAVDGGVVFFPAGLTYRITSRLDADYSFHTWILYGATIFADFDGVAVRFGSFSSSQQSISVHGGSVVRLESFQGDWSAGNVGVQFVNVSRFLYDDFYIRGFEKGLSLVGGGDGEYHSRGTQSGTIIPKQIVTCKFPLHFYAQVGGWCTEHNVFGGHLGYQSSDPDATGGYSAYIGWDHWVSGELHSWQPNNIRFYGVAFESGKSTDLPTGAVFADCQNLLLDYCRYEFINFTDPYINNDDAQYVDVRGGVGSVSPGSMLTSPVVIGTPKINFSGTNSNLFSGGSSTDKQRALMAWERNSPSNNTFVVMGTDGTENFAVKGSGEMRIGAAASGAKYYPRIFSGSGSWSPNIASGASATTTVGVTNAQVGDIAIAGFSAIASGILLTAAVTAVHTVTVTAHNLSGSTWNPGGGTLNAVVFEPVP